MHPAMFSWLGKCVARGQKSRALRYNPIVHSPSLHPHTSSQSSHLIQNLPHVVPPCRPPPRPAPLPAPRSPSRVWCTLSRLISAWRTQRITTDWHPGRAPCCGEEGEGMRGGGREGPCNGVCGGREEVCGGGWLQEDGGVQEWEGTSPWRLQEDGGVREWEGTSPWRVAAMEASLEGG